MKKPDTGNGVIVMKKLTTRGLQALAGGPSRLRSSKPSPFGAQPSKSAQSPEVEKMRPPVDSLNEVTLPRETAVKPIALASDEEIDHATLLVEQAQPKLRDEDIETLMQSNPLSSPRPAAGLAAREDERVERVERTALLVAPPPSAAMPSPLGEPEPPKPQMTLRTPPTLIHAQNAIPDEIRQLAIKALADQKAAAAAPPPPAAPLSQPMQAKTAVTPVPQKPQPGAPALVKGGGKVQIVVRETKRRTAVGWTAMLLALGVFVGLSTVAVIHGDARHAWDAAKNYASPKPAEPVIAAAPAVQAPGMDPVAVAPAPVPPPIAAPAPAADPIAANTDLKVADNKPSDVKDDAKASPKPEPKPEVTKPDPAPRPQQRPSNAYASAPSRFAAAKPEPKPEPMFVAAKPEPKPKPEPVAAAIKPKPEKDPAPAPTPAAKPKDDDVAKISQMAQQQLGAALP